MIEVGKMAAYVGIHGMGDHSVVGMKLRHGEKKDAQHGCWDGTVPVQHGGSLKKREGKHGV